MAMSRKMIFAFSSSKSVFRVTAKSGSFKRVMQRSTVTLSVGSRSPRLGSLKKKAVASLRLRFRALSLLSGRHRREFRRREWIVKPVNRSLVVCRHC
jgi:hypothetical protein